MSYRYGVELILPPDFTAKAHRARKLICDQYASWTAEMFMVHITVSDFFQCVSETSILAVHDGLRKVAEDSHRYYPGFTLRHRGVNARSVGDSSIFLDFTGHLDIYRLQVLHNNVTRLLETIPGVVPNTTYARQRYRPHLALLQNANLTPNVFQEAVEFSNAVVRDLQIPAATSAWKLWLVRFQSQVAGYDWSSGRWSADLRWTILDSFPL